MEVAGESMESGLSKVSVERGTSTKRGCDSLGGRN